MLHIVIREMKNMARGQHHVRAVPWEYLSIGPRIMEHVNKHGLPRDSFLLRCPPMGTAPWEAKPNGPYTQAGECVKRLFGPQAQTHGGRRGCIQLLRSLGASDTEVNEFARWKSDKTIKEYSSTSAGRFLNLYGQAVEASEAGILSLPPSSARNLTGLSEAATAKLGQCNVGGKRLAAKPHPSTPAHKARSLPHFGALNPFFRARRARAGGNRALGLPYLQLNPALSTLQSTAVVMSYNTSVGP